MIIVRTTEFARALADLPTEIQELFEQQARNFQKSWRDPRLHVKKIKTLEGAYSIRVTRRYRAFFYFHRTDTAVFFEIDHRKDIYR